MGQCNREAMRRIGRFDRFGLMGSTEVESHCVPPDRQLIAQEELRVR